MNRTFPGRQRGLTLMETLLVLSMISVIAVGAIVLFKQADTKAKGTRATHQLGILAASVKRVYMTRPIYHPTGSYSAGGSSSQTLNSFISNRKGIPSDMDKNGDIRHAFDGTVNVYDDSHGSCDNSNSTSSKLNFCIEYQDLTKSACTFLATRGTVGGASEVGVNATGSSSMSSTSSISISTLISNCQATENNVLWFFGN